MGVTGADGGESWVQYHDVTYDKTLEYIKEFVREIVKHLSHFSDNLFQLFDFDLKSKIYKLAWKKGT